MSKVITSASLISTISLVLAFKNCLKYTYCILHLHIWKSLSTQSNNICIKIYLNASTSACSRYRLTSSQTGNKKNRVKLRKSRVFQGLINIFKNTDPRVNILIVGCLKILTLAHKFGC